MREMSLLGALLSDIMGGPQPNPRIHIPEGKHREIAEQTRQFIIDRIKEANPGADEKVCEECVMNIGLVTVVGALAVGVQNERSSGWVMRMTARAVDRMETFGKTLILGIKTPEQLFDMATITEDEARRRGILPTDLNTEE